MIRPESPSQQNLGSEPSAHGEECFRAIFERSFDALILFDDDGRCVEANAAALELIGGTEIVGHGIDEVIALPVDENPAEAAALWAGLLEPGCQFRECAVNRRDGSRRTARCRVTLQILAGLHLCQLCDVTESKQVANSYRTLVETTNTGYAIFDPEGRLVDANVEYVRLTGHASVEELRGRSFLEWTCEHDHERGATEFANCAAGNAVRNLEMDHCGNDWNIPVEINASAIDTVDGVRVLAICRDITERRAAQEQLRAAHDALESRVRARTAELALANSKIRSRARRQEIVAGFGQRALMGAAAETLMREAVELIGRTLQVDFADVLEWRAAPARDGDSAREDLLLRADFGWPIEWKERCVASSAGDAPESCALRAHEPLVFNDAGHDPRFHLSDTMRELGVVSGVSVAINGEGRPFGVLSAHSRDRRVFTSDDIYFVQSMGNILADAIQRERSDEVARTAQREAIQANNAKNEFLSRMSHELRTPLNAILGFGQLLEIERLNGSQQESVDQIVRAGRHLLDLVNEVLDIARIESGDLAFSTESVSLRTLAHDGADLMRVMAAQRQVEIEVAPSVEDCASFILGDRQRLRQVLLNLISNAVKYNFDGGKVTLELGSSATPDRVRLNISDTGIGIAPDKVFRLFRPFERLGAEDSDIAGDGIGLALSKRLLEAQRGALGYESRPGGGSVFWIELPLAEQPDVADLPLDLINTLLDDAREGSADSDEEHPRTVLHIEDNESNRLLVELLFVQRPGVHLLSTSRGKEGLRLARDRRPDLILLDMHLPDLSGDEVLHTLREDSTTRETPVVVISADASGPRIQRLREAGADDYLTKPFNVGQFLRMLDEHLVA